MSTTVQHEKIEQFSVLIKACKGAGLQDVVSKALAEPGLFVFGELIAIPNVQQLFGTEHEVVLRTLELFAFGTYMDYQANPESFLPLNATQLEKLKQLTMCTLAQKRATDMQRMSYGEVISGLHLDGIRSLEDFVIQGCVYTGLLKCKLDQVQRCIHVQDVFDRDVRPEELPDVTDGVRKLLGWVQRLMKELSDNVEVMALSHAEQTRTDDEFLAKLEQARCSVERMENIQQDEEMALDDDDNEALAALLHGTRQGAGTRAAGGAHRSHPPDPKRRR